MPANPLFQALQKEQESYRLSSVANALEPILSLPLAHVVEARVPGALPSHASEARVPSPLTHPRRETYIYRDIFPIYLI